MVDRINKISNNEIDKIVLDSKNSHNSLNIKITVERAVELTDLNWNDIIFGMQYDYFDIKSAVDFALLLIKNGAKDKYVYEISFLNPSSVRKEEFIEQYQRLFSKINHNYTTQESKDKILFLLLAFLFEQRNSFENPFHIIEIIYDDFGFPQSISCLIPYMQPDGESDSMDRLYDNWKGFIYNSPFLKTGDG